MKSILNGVAFFFVSSMAFAQQAPQKKLTLSLTPQDWQKVISVINQSHAPYPLVVEVQQIVIPPLEEQVKDTTKQITKPVPKKD